MFSNAVVAVIIHHNFGVEIGQETLLHINFIIYVHYLNVIIGLYDLIVSELKGRQ